MAHLPVPQKWLFYRRVLPVTDKWFIRVWWNYKKTWKILIHIMDYVMYRSMFSCNSRTFSHMYSKIIKASECHIKRIIYSMCHFYRFNKVTNVINRLNKNTLEGVNLNNVCRYTFCHVYIVIQMLLLSLWRWKLILRDCKLGGNVQKDERFEVFTDMIWTVVMWVVTHVVKMNATMTSEVLVYYINTVSQPRIPWWLENCHLNKQMLKVHK
jgi:hypothetical protein